MKSFEKFQYDTSPYVIDEEVEELDEDLVGMVKKGITATGNVLDKGKAMVKKAIPNPQAIKKVIPNPQAIQKNLTNRPQATAASVQAKKDKNEKTFTSKVIGTESGARKKEVKRYQREINKPILQKNKKEFTPVQTALKKIDGGQNRIVGGVRSSLARSVASGANQIRKGLTAKPDQKISYDSKGSGFGGPTMGVSKNIQQAGQNLGDTKMFKQTKQDPKTGRVTKGKVSGKLSDKMGLTDIVNIGKPESEDSKNKKTKNLKKKNKGFSDMVTGSNNKKKSSTTKITGSGGDQLELPIQNKSTQTQNKSAQTAAQTSPGTVAATGKEAEDEKKFQGSPSGVYDKNTGKPMSRYDTDPKKEPVIPKKDLKKNKKPKVTGDGFPTGDDATHWLDAQKQHSSKTPKLFEQFLFEIETRSTKKKKDGRGMHPHNEIKPMSGTNTITINPEDETSKYKRGY
tara:strand:- start:18 stop:1385 length:1368 start_codon:yes stop_codon:yes gene_type:complete